MVSFSSQEKLSEEDCRAITRHSNQAALCDNSDAALPSPITLQHGCCIDKASALEIASLHEFLHPLFHYIVIVFALRIKADGGLRLLGHEVHGKAYDGLYARHKEVGLESHLDITPHVIHLATVIEVEPMLVATGKTIGNGLCLSQSTSDKTQAQGLGFDVVTVQ